MCERRLCNLNISIRPKTRIGKRSVIMMLLILVLFITGSVLPWKPGYLGFKIITQNPLQGIITLLMFFIGVATLSMAATSVIKYKERSLLVFLAILVGLYSIIGFFGSVANVFFNFP